MLFKPVRRLLRDLACKAGYEVFDTVPLGIDFMRDSFWLSQQVRSSLDVFFDVGANVGQTSLRALKEFPDARIYAFEPTPAAFVELAKNIAAIPRIRAVQAALGSEKGAAELFLYEDTTLSSLNHESPGADRFGPPRGTLRCEVTTLDAFCAENQIQHISVLKVDAEGYNMPILRGADRLLRGKSIDFIYLEFFDVVSSKKDAGGDLVDLCKFLQPFGFRFVATYNDYLLFEPKFFTCSNVLFMRPELYPMPA
jgi:FkbM family methyltransferase